MENMENKIMKHIAILFSLMLFVGCSSKINEKVDYPFETLEIIPSKNNSTMSVVIIKTGIEGGATVPYWYEFYFSRDDRTLSRNKRFLAVRGLKSYKIKWQSVTTISVEVEAFEIVEFESDVVVKNKISHFYEVDDFKFTRSQD